MTEEKKRTVDEINLAWAKQFAEKQSDDCRYAISVILAEKDKEIARLRDDNKKLSARYLLELVKEVRAENKRLNGLLERRTEQITALVDSPEFYVKPREQRSEWLRQALQDDGKEKI